MPIDLSKVTDAELEQRALEKLEGKDPYFRPDPRRSKYNANIWYEYKDGPFVKHPGGHYEQTGNILLDENGRERSNERQHAFLSWEGPELFFGGSRGGGKSIAIIIDCLRYFDIPNYTAIILRRTWAELSMGAEAIIPLMKQFLYPFIHCKPWQVEWREKEHSFRSREGGVIQFAHAENERDIERFAGIPCQRAYFDELPMFTEYMYDYFKSGMRRRSFGAVSQVPIVLRGTGNPLGVGMEFVRNRFVLNSNREHLFIPSSLNENVFIDQTEYLKTLEGLPEVMRKKLLYGDWDIQFSGGIFDPKWFEIVPIAPKCRFWVRGWDTAGSVPTETNKNPDYTVSFPVGYDYDDTKNIYIDVNRMVRMRASAGEVEKAIVAAMDSDAMYFGKEILTVIEQQPGAAGKSEMERMRKQWAGRRVRFVPTGGKSKEERAHAFAAYAFCKEQKEGHVKIVGSGKNLDIVLNEIAMFGQKDVKDDSIDSLSLSFRSLTTMVQAGIIASGSNSAMDQGYRNRMLYSKMAMQTPRRRL